MEHSFFANYALWGDFFLSHNKQGDFTLHVIKWKFDGKICFTSKQTHQE